jgi:hypothetical protein
MPRVNNVYSVPTGTDGISNTTISSTAYNRFVHDVEFDLNLPRPIGAGGTGGSTISEAQNNLGLNKFSGHGKFGLYDSTTCKLFPFNGNAIVINSIVQNIPDAGVALPAAGLTPGTTYYVYAYMAGTTMMLEASPTIYAAQAGTAVMIKSGDPTRTLVGKVWPNVGPTFLDNEHFRLVLTWFNRQPLTLRSSYEGGFKSTTSGAPVELDPYARLVFLTWADSMIFGAFYGLVSNTEPATFTPTWIMVDGVNPGFALPAYYYAANTYPVSLNMSVVGLSEANNHYLNSYGAVSSGTGTWGANGYPPINNAILRV